MSEQGFGLATRTSMVRARQGLGSAEQVIKFLADQAIGHLASHGAEADLLRALARYIVERDR